MGHESITNKAMDPLYIYWDAGSWSLTIVSLMGLGNITKNAMDLKRIFEVCFVMIATDVSDRA